MTSSSLRCYGRSVSTDRRRVVAPFLSSSCYSNVANQLRATPILISSECLVDKPRWRIRSTILEATINFAHSRRVDHSSECMRRNAPRLHHLETTRSSCHWVQQVSSRMRDLLTFPTLSQSGQMEADVLLHQRAGPAASSGSSISPIHAHHDGFE